jgi:hypothetical protein
MGQDERLTPEEYARVSEIQDLLIDRYVERREALERGDTVRAKEIDLEIKDLKREKEEIQDWTIS